MTRKKEKNKHISPPAMIPLLQGARVELTYYRGGQMGVALFGCSDFITYSHECVAIRQKKRIVRITGTDLWCRTYGNRVAEVIGTVNEIRFEGGEDD